MSFRKPLLIPLPTPFTDDTVTISEVRVARLVRYYKDAGAAGFVVATEVGDHLCLSHSERKDMVEYVSRDSAGLPVIVNITAYTTAAMLDLCQHAERHGARGAIYRPPAALNLTDEELEALNRSFRRHIDLPVGIIGTPEQIKASMGERTDQNWTLPVDADGSGHFPISHTPVTCEFSCHDGICSPLSLFTPDRAEVIFRRRAETRAVAEGIWKLAGPMRFMRAAARLLPFEIAVGRGPTHDLSDSNAMMVRKLYESGA